MPASQCEKKGVNTKFGHTFFRETQIFLFGITLDADMSAFFEGRYIGDTLYVGCSDVRSVQTTSQNEQSL